MQEMIKLTLPKERFSPIDYFLEKENELKSVTGIKLTTSSYTRMKQDPYIYQDFKSGEYERWVGEETTIGDKHYPPLIYFLFKQDDGGALVKRIEYKEKVFEFEPDYNVLIDY